MSVIPLLAGVQKRRAAAGPTTLIEDAFTDTDATALSSHTIAPTNTPAASWASDSGAMDINGNKARTTTLASGLVQYRANAGVSDCVVSVDVTPVGASVLGMSLRRNSAVNQWVLVALEGIAGNLFRLYEQATGYTLRASTAVTVTAGVTYALRATLNGTSIVGTLNGTNEISFSSASYQTETNHGIRDDHTGSKFDNFKVMTL